MDNRLNPRPLETHIDWHSEDVTDPSVWTVELTETDQRELDHERRSMVFRRSQLP